MKTGPPFQFFPDGGKLTRRRHLPAGAHRARSRPTGSGSLPIAPSADAGGGATDRLHAHRGGVQPGPPAGTRGGRRARASRGCGSPTAARGAPADTHVYAQIVDTARNLVLGNVSTPIPVKLDGQTHTIERPLEPVAARAVAGKRYRLQIASASTLYTRAAQHGAGGLQPQVGITLPLVDAKAPPPLGAARRAHPGHAPGAPRPPFRVRVRALGDTLTGVRRAAARSAQPQIGSSTPFTLKGRTRKPRVRVTGGMRPGRYRIVATGANAEGITGARFRQAAEDQAAPMRIAVAADERTGVAEAVAEGLRERGHEVAAARRAVRGRARRLGLGERGGRPRRRRGPRRPGRGVLLDRHRSVDRGEQGARACAPRCAGTPSPPTARADGTTPTCSRCRCAPPARRSSTEILDAWFAGRPSDEHDDVANMRHVDEIGCLVASQSPHRRSTELVADGIVDLLATVGDSAGLWRV